MTFENARFTVLTSRLVRMEFSASQRFEDWPSQAFWDRVQLAWAGLAERLPYRIQN